MFATDNNIKVLVGKDLTVTATPSIDPQSANFIADGEVAILTEALPTGGVESVYPAAGGPPSVREYIRFAQRSGADVHYSPRIKVSNIIKATKLATAPAADQVDRIGYNGTSGSIEVLNNNQYLLHITYKHDDQIWSEQLNKRTYAHYSDTTATQQEVASDLVKQINMDGYTAVSAVMLTDSTGAALTTTGQNCTVVNGSDTVVFAGNVTIATGAFIKIGGTATTTPVYKVKTGVTAGTTITLDTPYQGVSATVLNANVNTCNAILYVGIQLTGKALTYKPNGISRYNRVKFETAIANFGSTIITNTTVMAWGTGLYEQVADMEWFALGGDGIRNRMWHPIPEGRTDATVGKTYTTYTVEYYNSDDMYVISGTKPAKALVYLFFETNAVGDNDTTFETAFEAYTGLAV